MSTNKTIAKNTLFLYFRMLLVMGVSLFTSRIVLQQLGVSDYGIYSLVGGVVVLFGFFNAAMSSATQRYLSFDIGKGNAERLQKTFSATLTIHMGIALLVLLLAETIGLWYINYKMVFPIERTFAVNVVYQFSIFSFLLGIIQVPYNALIIARERMDVYAYVSILEVILKLIIVFLLLYFGSDKLITYAALTFLVAVIIRLVYQIYCRRQFGESKYRFEYDKVYYRELISYSGWSMFGSMAVVARGQGINVILNLFFGTTINAAYGITMQVQNALSSFIYNFLAAVKPQIIQSYAQNNLKRSHALIAQSSKYSFYLLYFISVPVLFNIDYILSLWLGKVPEYTAGFVILCMIGIMIECLSEPLIVGIHASGKIKRYQIILSLLISLNLPISYIFLKNGYPPSTVFIVIITTNFFAFFYRLASCSKLTGLSWKSFLKNTFFRICIVAIFTVVIGLVGYSFIFQAKEGLSKVLYSSMYISLVTIILIFFLGLSVDERQKVVFFVKNKVL